MFGWARSALTGTLVALQKREVRDRVSQLRALRADEIAPLTLAVLVVAGRLLQTKGIDLMARFDAVAGYADLPLDLGAIAKEQERAGRPLAATAFKIWQYTLQATLSPELRPDVRALWDELRRGRLIAMDAAVHQDLESHMPTNDGARVAYAARWPDGYG